MSLEEIVLLKDRLFDLDVTRFESASQAEQHIADLFSRYFGDTRIITTSDMRLIVEEIPENRNYIGKLRRSEAFEHDAVTYIPLTNPQETTIGVLEIKSEEHKAQFPLDQARYAQRHVGQLVRAARVLEKERHKADYDDLTRLLNRGGVKKRLSRELKEYEGPLAAIMVDVDHFKQYNDSYGHPQGDEALRQVAQVIERSCRTTDITGRFTMDPESSDPTNGLGGRYGGEEFFIYVRDEKAAKQIAERIRNDIERTPIYVENLPEDQRAGADHVTVSVGVATVEYNYRDPAKEQTIERVKSLADEALYQAKARGRNRVEFYSVENQEGYTTRPLPPTK